MSEFNDLDLYAKFAGFPTMVLTNRRDYAATFFPFGR